MPLIAAVCANGRTRGGALCASPNLKDGSALAEVCIFVSFTNHELRPEITTSFRLRQSLVSSLMGLPSGPRNQAWFRAERAYFQAAVIIISTDNHPRTSQKHRRKGRPRSQGLNADRGPLAVMSRLKCATSKFLLSWQSFCSRRLTIILFFFREVAEVQVQTCGLRNASTRVKLGGV